MSTGAFLEPLECRHTAALTTWIVADLLTDRARGTHWFARDRELSRPSSFVLERGASAVGISRVAAPT
jgi:hypothetical protein